MDKKLEKLVKNIELAIEEAEKYADSIGESFSLEIAYGMGGTYYPNAKPISRKEAIEELASGEDLSETRIKILRDVLANTSYDNETWEESSYNDSGWNASSQSC